MISYFVSQYHCVSLKGQKWELVNVWARNWRNGLCTAETWGRWYWKRWWFLMHENNQERKWTRIRSKGIELRVLNIESSWKKKTDTAADDHTDEEEEEEVLDREYLWLVLMRKRWWWKQERWRIEFRVTFVCRRWERERESFKRNEMVLQVEARSRSSDVEGRKLRTKKGW